MKIEDIYDALNSLAVLIRDGKDNSEKFTAVGKFDDIIFQHEETIVNEEIDDMLVDLVHDLEYYNPNPEDICYYGDKEFFEKVNPVLDKLRKEMEGGDYEKTQ